MAADAPTRPTAACPDGLFRYETDVYVYCARCEWTIRNWRHAVKEGSNSYLDSPPFHAPELPDVQWHLRLWPNRRYGAGQSPQMDVAVFVNRSDLIHSTEMICSLWSISPGVKERTFNGTIKRTDYWGLSSRICAKPDELTCRDLVLECNMRHALKSTGSRANLAQMDTSEADAKERDGRSKLVAREQLQALACYQSLLADEQFSDITICLPDGQSWPAHRAVLAARSPVFRAMLSHPMSEQEKRTVHLVEDEEIDEPTWTQFMQFLYTGSVADLESHCFALLKLADKYEVPGLRALSAMAIGEQLGEESLPHALVLAFLHGAAELRAACLRFLRGAGPGVYATAEWRELMARWPDVVVDALKGVAAPHQPRLEARTATATATEGDDSERAPPPADGE